eukprot:TRINITY_DN1969_c0_g1_i1.p1 TRINITY_DN1969_c0_g1~~TRINITY_DN1969_c0_g1_i1.p1  ORF type:complete len:314 (+),score=115.42 TRINITY_DN1969_c0_g1_i1:515-1456(+)
MSEADAIQELLAAASLEENRTPFGRKREGSFGFGSVPALNLSGASISSVASDYDDENDFSDGSDDDDDEALYQLANARRGVKSPNESDNKQLGAAPKFLLQTDRTLSRSKQKVDKRIKVSSSSNSKEASSKESSNALYTRKEMRALQKRVVKQDKPKKKEKRNWKATLTLKRKKSEGSSKASVLDLFGDQIQRDGSPDEGQDDATADSASGGGLANVDTHMLTDGVAHILHTDATVAVKHASLVRLVRWFVLRIEDENTLESDNIEAQIFLTCYRRYATPRELLDLLKSIYNSFDLGAADGGPGEVGGGGGGG